MPLLEHELVRRVNGQLELRPHPLRIQCSFSDLVASDGHDIRCTFECSVRALPDPTERRMLQEVLLQGREQVTGDIVASHFDRPLRSELRRLVETTTTADLLSDPGRASVREALKRAAGSIAFASGLEVLPPFQVDVESPGHEQARLREMHRTAAERHAAGQVEHFQRATELLQQFNAVRQSAPELSTGQVLQQMNPSDRGSMLQSLLRASAKDARATSLWAVAGPYLVRVDAGREPELNPLPPTLGPLRSVQPAMIDGERVLLVGARSGFMIVRPGSADEPQTYVDPQVNSQLGFNRVVYSSDANCFIASHGDAGIVRWSMGNVESPEFRLSVERLRELFPAACTTATPRNVEPASDSRIGFTFGNILATMPGGGETPVAIKTSSQAEIVAVLPADRRVAIVHEDGVVCGVDRSTLDITGTQRTGSKIRAAGALPWLGSTRLLLGGDDGAIQCIGLDDPLVTQYASSHHAPRVVAGSSDLVAAVSADRQRLILWNAWDGHQPAKELYLTGLTRHRIADLDFA